MAKIPFGVLGPFFGKAGPISGYTWKGKAVMRSQRKPSNKPPTAAQAQQQNKFGVVSRFLGGISDFIKTSFKELAIGKTEFQCAMSYNMANAVSGTNPDFTLHYDRVAVSRGSLPNAVLPEAKARDAAGEIIFTWADNTGIGLAAAADKAIPVLYYPGRNIWTRDIKPAVSRADGSVVLSIPGFSGQAIHTWLTFISEEGKAADSVYTGEVLVR